MFPTRYYPARYFAPRYWPKVGAEVVDVGLGIVEAAQLYCPGAERGQLHAPGCDRAQLGD